ncbi:hypothetical protein D4764_0180910 [Takifugu flavidus]|uniref:Uncharacterized protein n=1 Tax=Takifugu flavidus TaxID=433684 RepID=A0A5C6ME44_9TELE|nr:hypothetical protein D4764_0180910 [Takifugu flavidus]
MKLIMDDYDDTKGNGLRNQVEMIQSLRTTRKRVMSELQSHWDEGVRTQLVLFGKLHAKPLEVEHVYIKIIDQYVENPSVPGDYLSPSGEDRGSDYVPSSSTHFDDEEEEQAPFNNAPEDAPEDVDATEGHKESVSKKEEEVAKCQPPRSKKRKNQASDMDDKPSAMDPLMPSLCILHTSVPQDGQQCVLKASKEVRDQSKPHQPTDDSGLRCLKTACDEAKRRCRLVTQNPSEVQWILTFGKYRGKIFQWLVENDVGYIKYIVDRHVKEKQRPERGPINDEWIKDYLQFFPQVSCHLEMCVDRAIYGQGEM